MESRAIPVIFGILMGAGLGGCSSPDAPREEAETPGGGMDGGGQFVLGLAWDRQVFLQPLWQNGKLTMLVVNQRAQPIQVAVARYLCPDDGVSLADACRADPMETLARWQVAAASTATFDGTPLLVEALALSVKVDGERLGLMEMPRAPLGGESGAFISNQGHSNTYHLELATRFARLPGATFQAQLTLTHGGRLSVAPSASLGPNLVTLTPLAARADGVDVAGSEFFVDVPESTSEQNPFSMELDFAAPAGAPSGSLFVLHPGRLCIALDDRQSCTSIVETLRVLPPP